MRKWEHFNFLNIVYVKPFLKLLFLGIGQRTLSVSKWCQLPLKSFLKWLFWFSLSRWSCGHFRAFLCLLTYLELSADPHFLSCVQPQSGYLSCWYLWSGQVAYRQLPAKGLCLSLRSFFRPHSCIWNIATVCLRLHGYTWNKFSIIRSLWHTWVEFMVLTDFHCLPLSMCRF